MITVSVPVKSGGGLIVLPRRWGAPIMGSMYSDGWPARSPQQSPLLLSAVSPSLGLVPGVHHRPSHWPWPPSIATWIALALALPDGPAPPPLSMPLHLALLIWVAGHLMGDYIIEGPPAGRRGTRTNSINSPINICFIETPVTTRPPVIFGS